MKELSIEEKAKRYDEVVAMAKECITHIPDEAVNKYMLNMFPELKESEDEKVIRDIKVVLECSATKFFKEEGKMPIWYDRAVAWLEKQSESNPYSGVSFKHNGHTWGMCARDNGVEVLLDGQIKQRVFLDKIQALREMVNNAKKVEPKFKVGDWVVGANNVYKIISLNDELNCYIAVTPNNEEVKIPYYFDDEQGHICSYHLWTIQDAEDGDVLRLGCVIAIFKSIFKHSIGSPKCVCYCSFYKDRGFEIPIENGENNVYGCTNTTPATPKERDLLFQKMKEAGYEWDADKKELKSK